MLNTWKKDHAITHMRTTMLEYKNLHKNPKHHLVLLVNIPAPWSIWDKEKAIFLRWVIINAEGTSSKWISSFESNAEKTAGPETLSAQGPNAPS